MIVKSAFDEIQNYLVDASNFKGNCEKVFIAESIEEIIPLVIDANNKKIKITVCGNHTGLTGSSIPTEGFVLSTEKLNRIIEIDFENNYAIVESGVLLKNFQDELNTKGYFFPPDPTETNCFIGGVIATNASGGKSFKYGATRNFVLEIEIILSDGEILELKRGKNFAKGNALELSTKSGKKIKIELPEIKAPEVKNAAGYFCKSNMDAIDLFIGSEGTLGVITNAKLKILTLPVELISFVAFFNSEEDGLSFVDAVRTQTLLNNNSENISARAIEYFDKNSLIFLSEDYPEVDCASACGVWIEQEVTENNFDLLIEKWYDLIKKFNANDEKVWIGFDEKDKKKLKEFRHAISYKVNEYISKNNFRKLGTDTAVPDNNFKIFYFNSKKLVEENNLNYVAYGHFGNSHLHLNILPKDDSEFLVAKKIIAQICSEAVRLNGTVSAEHGIGKLKKNYFQMMYNENTINKLFEIKKILDPNLILGDGNIF